MSYVALARRYRPQKFAEVVGQPQVTDTLCQAIAAGRVAAAYLFTGPRGSGKTTVARILAKAVNCDAPKDGEPCGKCEPCVSIADGRSLDVLEIDGASNNSVDDVRELRENVGYAASRPGKRKVYIVDEVHMLSKGAFNALLKTLEEPPAHVMFVFATTAPRDVPATIVSRCQRFDFRRLQTDEIRDRLVYIIKQEKLDVEDAAIFLLAKRADGSLRDALSLLDQVVSSSTGRIGSAQVTSILGLVPVEAYFEITRAVLERDARQALSTLHGVLAQGADAGDFVLGLVEHLRNLLLLSIDGKLRGEVQLGDMHLKDAQELAGRFRTEDLLFLLNRAAVLHEDTRRTSQPVVGLEAALVEMTRFESRVVLTELLERLDGEPGGGPCTPAPAGGSTRGATPPPASGTGSGRRTPTSRPRAESAADEQVRAGADADADAQLESPGPRGADGPAQIGASRPSPTPTETRGEPQRLAPWPTTPAAPAPSLDIPVAGEPTRIAARADVAAGGPPPPSKSLRPAAQAESGPVATATLDLEHVARRWADFSVELRATKAFLSVCLAEGKPVRLVGSVLDVWFPPEHTFHLHAVQDAIRQRELEPYLEMFFGQRLKLAIALEESPAAAPPASSARLTPDDIARSRRGAIDDVVQNTPAIEDIIQAFDGEVLEDDDG